MRSGAVGFGVFLALASAFFPGRARACEVAIPPMFKVDPAQVGVDTTPPELTQPIVMDVQKIDRPGGGCQPTCGWDHKAMLTNLATDDVTPVSMIGYRVTLVAGPAPGPTTRLTVPVLPESADHLELFWNSDDDFDYTIQLFAIDSAGNESAPRTVQISSGGGGCNVGPRRASDGLAFAVLALAVAIAIKRPLRTRSRSRARTPRSNSPCS